MASTVSKKRTSKTRVGEMTTDQLQAMMERVIDRKLSEWATNPRIARRRAEIARHAEETRAEYHAGKVKRGNAQDLLADMDS